tara:strand:+ start:6101 stop:8152 length:2052 start_codon:yes stop_codon:yes gene_type:complete
MEYDKRAEINKDIFEQYRDARADWDREAREDLDFYFGNHFTDDESQHLASVNQADVPMDRIGPAIDKMKAMLTSRSPAFTIVPREDSDVKLASVWRTILGYTWQISNATMHLKQAIHDYTTTGLGYLYAYTDTESDMGKGDIKIVNIDPFRVYVPPNCRDRWFDDADNVILSTILTGQQVVNQYPELGPQPNPETGEIEPGLIEELSGYMDFDFPSSQNKQSQTIFTPDVVKDKDHWDVTKYQILERFYKTKVPFYRVVDTKNQTEMVMDDMEFQQFLDENPAVFERGLMEFEEVLQTRVGVTASIGEVVLYETILNTEVYPIVPLPNNYAGTPYPRSDVQRAKEMQRLLNKLWSLALSHAQASAGLKLIVPLGSVDDVAELEKNWSNPNAVIEIDSSQGEPHYPQPSPLSGEFYRLIQSAEFYIDFIFGIPEMMHGYQDKAPDTVRGTERMISLGQERPKSKLRDIEFSLERLGLVMYSLSKGHYNYKKMFRLSQANNDLDDVTINMYDDITGTVVDIQKERHDLGQHDISIEPGSTLPTNKWTEYGVYLEAYQAGLVDRQEVLKKNPEIFDKAGVLNRFGEIAQLQQQLAQATQQIKSLQGDLQTASRESIHAKKALEVQKTKSVLDGLEHKARAEQSAKGKKLDAEVKVQLERLKNSTEMVYEEEKAKAKEKASKNSQAQ